MKLNPQNWKHGPNLNEI